ncbi:MAG: family 43 glycosylhydrolase [Breznakibacter sp.]
MSVDLKRISAILAMAVLMFFGVRSQSHGPQNGQKNQIGEPYSAYLFAYFTGNKMDEEQIRFAISADGYRFIALNGNRPVVESAAISSTGGVRDPHILRAEDGKTFYMVATDMVSANGWNSNRAMVLMKSRDLITWTSSVVNIQKRFSGNENLQRVWAPQTIFDKEVGKYLVYWSMQYSGGTDIIYYAYANASFTDLASEPKQLFFPREGKSCIDADIVYKDGLYHLFYKTEGHGNGIRKATSKSLTSGNWAEDDRYLQQTTEAVEGSSVFKLTGKNEYIFMYDVYGRGKYQFCSTNDLQTFMVIDDKMQLDFHPRHGTVIPVTSRELKRLVRKWGDPDSTINLPPNPVLKGYYADPDVLYSGKTEKYYIYPTSDGFDGWSGTYFKAFSSANLSDWQDEGVILDLTRDVAWANRNAWAPCIIEKKKGKDYLYYYYFTAAQKIGVAVSSNPTGPFVDSGKALVDRRPEGVTDGQEIDPDVFTDPRSKKTYLYWGNGYMAVAELGKDMVSVKPNTTKVITPDNTYREGTCVFFRNGKYYFLWSEDDTRSENYRVRYGIADSPTGPIHVPQDNLILAKDPSKGIYGTGHNSVLQIPGKDEWYIVYHRFCRPDGIKMGDAAGFHREVCMDKLEFEGDKILKVKVRE